LISNIQEKSFWICKECRTTLETRIDPIDYTNGHLVKNLLCNCIGDFVVFKILVDIKLGGNPGGKDLYEEIKSVGGLFVLGTERHEARRIDNQLRGR
jgi:hypothetical protein